MRLQLCTWPEVEEYLERSCGIILPIGSTEQHGPVGLIGTDALCAELIALEVGSRCQALVGPTLPIGMSQHHLGFPGSMSLRPSTLLSLVFDAVSSLAKHGFRRFYFINGHGGNVAPVHAAFSELYTATSLEAGDRQPPALRCKLDNWWNRLQVHELAQALFGDAEGQHATCSELAVTFHAFPDRERCETLEPRRAPTGPIYDAHDFRQRFPDGRMGSDPSLATGQAGSRVFEVAVAAIARDYEAFLREP